ncbi:MAG: type II toxin-antitoxin system RelE/ParE family toxin [Candidatus Brennerbacteria bacterium]|nr:type II toxin-antitoxin system RelE/ParE family toxin [Candidatus Brennerbacteria bacterium]
MYRRVITPSAKRSLKKLPFSVRKTLVDSTKILESDPYAGEKLSGSLRFLYSFHFKVSNIQYRVAYTINQNDKLIIMHFAHTRENFYEKLHHLFK